MLREDVVDKVIKRDVLSLFNVRNPLSMEKLFLYLCMNSSGIFNKQTTAKELTNIGAGTIEDYPSFPEKSNLIYISNPIMVGKKAALKGRPKIYIADAAIRNAVLMIDDVLPDNSSAVSCKERGVKFSKDSLVSPKIASLPVANKNSSKSNGYIVSMSTLPTIWLRMMVA